MMGVRLIVISGSMGSGKTTVLAEASDLLTAGGVVHAAIDLDALGFAHLPVGTSDDLMYRNLASVWGNYAGAGVNRLLLAAAIESRAELDRIHQAIPDAEILTCRLRATLATMQQRVRVREPGMLQEKFVARTVDLERLLDSASLEDFSLTNNDGPVTEVARELLRRAGWL
jgi:predicted kinase